MACSIHRRYPANQRGGVCVWKPRVKPPPGSASKAFLSHLQFSVLVCLCVYVYNLCMCTTPPSCCECISKSCSCIWYDPCAPLGVPLDNSSPPHRRPLKPLCLFYSTQLDPVCPSSSTSRSCCPVLLGLLQQQPQTSQDISPATFVRSNILTRISTFLSFWFLCAISYRI